MPSILNATTTSGLVTSADNSGSLQLQTNSGTTAVTIDTSQNVGIGTSSPQARLHQNSTNDGVQAIFTGAQTGTTQTILFRSQYQTNNGTAGFANIGWFDNGSQGGGLTFGTTSNGSGTTGTPTERMRIDSSGNLFVGTTTNSGQTSRFTIKKSGNIGTIYAEQLDSGGYNYNSRCFNNGGTYYHFQFEAGTTQVGSIVSNGSNTTYNTGSDYRLKDNVETMLGGLDAVKALKPVTWKWKSTGENGQGFIAHELAEICPDAVTGEKDAVDENGKPIYQMVDVSYLVATLTAAIQEQQAMIETLQAEVQALKGVA